MRNDIADGTINLLSLRPALNTKMSKLSLANEIVFTKSISSLARRFFVAVHVFSFVVNYQFFSYTGYIPSRPCCHLETHLRSERFVQEG